MKRLLLVVGLLSLVPAALLARQGGMGNPPAGGQGRRRRPGD